MSQARSPGPKSIQPNKKSQVELILRFTSFGIGDSWMLLLWVLLGVLFFSGGILLITVGKSDALQWLGIALSFLGIVVPFWVNRGRE